MFFGAPLCFGVAGARVLDVFVWVGSLPSISSKIWSSAASSFPCTSARVALGTPGLKIGDRAILATLTCAILVTEAPLLAIEAVHHIRVRASIAVLFAFNRTSLFSCSAQTMPRMDLRMLPHAVLLVWYVASQTSARHLVRLRRSCSSHLQYCVKNGQFGSGTSRACDRLSHSLRMVPLVPHARQIADGSRAHSARRPSGASSRMMACT